MEIKVKILKIILIILFISMPENATATKLFSMDFESQACNIIIQDGAIVNSTCIDYWGSSDIPYYRCSLLKKPSGNIYVEWDLNTILTDAGTDFYNGTCGGVDNDLATDGTTYYLSTFVRFERINEHSIWHDTSVEENSFDKLIEMTGYGFRWGMYSGWPQGRYNAVSGKFTFMAWYGQGAAIPDGSCGDGGSDNIAANISPYGINNPYLADYERWYALVLAVTPKADNTGRVQMWVNGTKIIDTQNCKTAMNNPTINRVTMHGTIAQPGYDAPAHKRQADRIMVTDYWQDVVDGGYLQDPETGGRPSDDRVESGGGCFIATAAFGAHPNSYVEILRIFRDRFLLSNYPGRAFVSLYYKVSPFVAEFISHHESLKTIVRWILIPLVGFIWVTLKIGPIATFGLMALIVILIGRSLSISISRRQHKRINNRLSSD